MLIPWRVMILCPLRHPFKCITQCDLLDDPRCRTLLSTMHTVMWQGAGAIVKQKMHLDFQCRLGLLTADLYIEFRFGSVDQSS